ncbi:interleukin-21 [Sarcophilus harrisii]|uniref:Interleukin n=1 Tax=Sarcophilus harrisii TaxID=9305 RepID=A0A7N4PK96_SARHA|nr:interleukin-21 [Sarcophilus harrisii]
MERTFIYCLVIIFFGTVAPKQNPLNRRQTRLMQLVQIAKQLKTCVNDTDPALLSTPENVEKHCEESALKCFQEAPLKPLNNEEKKMRFDVLIKQLRRKLPQREARKTNPKCPSCDSFKMKPPQEFLNSLQSLLQKMISYDHHSNHHHCHGQCT